MNNVESIEELKAKSNAIKDYIESLNSIETTALTIAIRELESSFSIEKSIGFINFQKNTTIQFHKT
jgi:prefoldin subunit 5